MDVEVATKLENHEIRIKNLEEFKDIVNTLKDTIKTTNETANKANETAEKTNIAVEKTNETVKLLYDSILELQKKDHDKDVIKAHSLSNHLWKLIKGLTLKDWITIIVFIAGAIVALTNII